MSDSNLRFPEVGISLPLRSEGVRIIALVQLLLVVGVLSSSVTAVVPEHLRGTEAVLMLVGSALALVTTVPALFGGRFRFWVAGVGSIVTTLVMLALVGLVGSWLAHLFGWPLLAVSIIAVAYHLVGDPSTRRR